MAKWLLLLILLYPCLARAETFEATAYCSCFSCCNKTDGITASGKKAIQGITVAINWLPFGTRLSINGQEGFIVQDRGAKSIFGSKDKHKKRIDIYFNSHKEALRFGRRSVEVEILN